MSCTTGSGFCLAGWWRRCPWKGIVRPPMHKAVGLTAGRVHMFRNAATAAAEQTRTMYLTDGEGHARRVSGGGWAVPPKGSPTPAPPLAHLRHRERDEGHARRGSGLYGPARTA